MENTMKKLLFLLILLVTPFAHAQLVGDEVLQLNSGTTTEMNTMTNPQTGQVIYNTTTKTLWHYDGTNWVQTDTQVNVVSTDTDNQIEIGTDNGAYLGPTVYTGFFIINSNGSQAITGIPFQPSQITFVAHANIESLNINADNQTNNNNTGISNSFGSMNGFARDNGGSTTQQVIYVGGSGNSINDISRYASSSNCIGIRYGNQNGDNLGLLSADISSFNSNGFTINVTRTSNATSENLVVLYTAYK